jgi:hypothetical protein
MDYISEATQKHIDDLVKTINKLNKERNKLTAENKAQAKQLILSGVVKSFYCLDEVHRGKKDRCKQQCEYCTGFS